MEILGKEINRTNDLRGKIYQNLKCLLQLSTNWTLNQSCPPSKWAWNNFWTNHINVPQHSMWFLLHICRKKWWRDIKMMTRAWVVISDKNHHACSVPEVSPSKETVYTSETLTLCLKTGLCTLAGPCVWPIRNLGLFATFLSTWWKAFGWWILCSPQKSLYVVKKKKGLREAPEWHKGLGDKMWPLPWCATFGGFAIRSQTALVKKQLIFCETYYSPVCTMKPIISCCIIAISDWDRDSSVHTCFFGTSGHL